jgi:hypothetical protein
VKLAALSPNRRMVHDLNNLLFVLFGRCENMRDQLAADHPVHADIDAITMAAERPQAIVADLRTLDLADAGTRCPDSSTGSSGLAP